MTVFESWGNTYPVLIRHLRFGNPTTMATYEISYVLYLFQLFLMLPGENWKSVINDCNCPSFTFHKSFMLVVLYGHMFHVSQGVRPFVHGFVVIYASWFTWTKFTPPTKLTLIFFSSIAHSF